MLNVSDTWPGNVSQAPLYCRQAEQFYCPTICLSHFSAKLCGCSHLSSDSPRPQPVLSRAWAPWHPLPILSLPQNKECVGSTQCWGGSSLLMSTAQRWTVQGMQSVWYCAVWKPVLCDPPVLQGRKWWYGKMRWQWNLPESCQRTSDKSFFSWKKVSAYKAQIGCLPSVPILATSVCFCYSYLSVFLPWNSFHVPFFPVFPQGPVTMVCFLLVAWAAFPQPRLHYPFFSDGITAASLRGVSHVRSWADFIFHSTSPLPQRELLQGEQCYFCATFALAASGKIINKKGLWASLAEKQAKTTGSIRPAALLSHSAP